LNSQICKHSLETNLTALEVKQLSGVESFHFQNKNIPINVLSFWRWSASNLAGNNLRGHLAEYLVASDLGISQNTRIEWDSYDLLFNSDTRLEVKSAAFLQSWHQNKLSAITFSIAPTHSWDPKTGIYSKDCIRNSDVYIFCLLIHKDKNTLDPTNLDQWEFYILPTKTLNEKLGSQKTISLNSLRKLNPVYCKYGQIAEIVKNLL